MQQSEPNASPKPPQFTLRMMLLLIAALAVPLAAIQAEMAGVAASSAGLLLVGISVAILHAIDTTSVAGNGLIVVLLSTAAVLVFIVGGVILVFGLMFLG